MKLPGCDNTYYCWSGLQWGEKEPVGKLPLITCNQAEKIKLWVPSSVAKGFQREELGKPKEKHPPK